jgi:hypothetical protein
VVSGTITHARVRANPYRPGRDGRIRFLPGNGGICLNFGLGDRATQIVGDHVEPGVSIRNDSRAPGADPMANNRGLLGLSCIGNRATVVSGPAEGSVGMVIGKHGGPDHVLLQFAPETLARLRIGDTIQVESHGQGLAFRRASGVAALNLAPNLLRRWGLRERHGQVAVPVVRLVPAVLMGSGVGQPHGMLGDVDIQLTPRNLAEELGLWDLRIGDIVAVVHFDMRYGASHAPGRVTYGVVVHSNSTVAGHGPGVTPLLVGPIAKLVPRFSPQANLATIFGFRSTPSAMPAPNPGRWRAVLGGEGAIHAIPHVDGWR